MRLFASTMAMSKKERAQGNAIGWWWQTWINFISWLRFKGRQRLSTFGLLWSGAKICKRSQWKSCAATRAATQWWIRASFLRQIGAGAGVSHIQQFHLSGHGSVPLRPGNWGSTVRTYIHTYIHEVNSGVLLLGCSINNSLRDTKQKELLVLVCQISICKILKVPEF